MGRQAGILDEVKDERKQQDQQWGGEEHDDQHTVGVWLGYIERQILKCRQTPRREYLQRARFVKIAALAVAAIERIDRRRNGHG